MAGLFTNPLAPPDTAWDDAQLVAACLAGDAKAWESLIEKHKRLIYAIPFRYGATASDAADIFQGVCLELYEELPKLRRVESLRSWLMTVAARQSLRWKRGNARFTNLEPDSAEPDPEAVSGAQWLAGLEKSQIVGEALEKLPERCRLLIKRLFFDDPPLPYQEIAAELGLATGSIGFYRGNCLQKMRKALEEAGL